MNWTLPGTTLQTKRSDAGRTDGLFQSMMLTGGLTLGQVATITGLEPYTVQNWVKLCRIITINMLRGALPLEKICGLLSYINGSLTDESDDIIDDTALYFMFVKLAARARDLEGAEWDSAIGDTLTGYLEPYPGARQRIETVLRIMLTAWISTRMRQEADAMLNELT